MLLLMTLIFQSLLERILTLLQREESCDALSSWDMLKASSSNLCLLLSNELIRRDLVTSSSSKALKRPNVRRSLFGHYASRLIIILFPITYNPCWWNSTTVVALLIDLFTNWKNLTSSWSLKEHLKPPPVPNDLLSWDGLVAKWSQ